VIPAMLERFRSAGLESREIEVKVFGGANVIHLGGAPSHDRWIGTANVAAARLLLRHAKLTISCGRVGGNQGCKIVFNTQTGEVLHKHLSGE
jgi:chemotaxis protein CheD